MGLRILDFKEYTYETISLDIGCILDIYFL
jgi:hypothetical protein